jgi:two-component system NtrC family sensor kinase
LGLSICYGIINKLGGRIEVTSTVDVGSTFSVYIPASEGD